MLAKRAANIKTAVSELASSYETLKSSLNENETYTQVSVIGKIRKQLQSHDLFKIYPSCLSKKVSRV